MCRHARGCAGSEGSGNAEVSRSTCVRARSRSEGRVGAQRAHALQVHVQPEVQAGIRNVAAINDVLHIPRRAVKRVAQLSEARNETPQLASRIARLGVRDTADEEQSGALQLGDGAQEPTRRFEVTVLYIEILVGNGQQRGRCRPRRYWDVLVERMQCGGARMSRQERMWEERAVSVYARPGDVYTIRGRLHGFGRDRGRHIG
jgi:hypothetical protein